MPSKQVEIENANYEMMSLAKASIVGFVRGIVDGDEISDRVKARANELLSAHDRAREHFWRGSQPKQDNISPEQADRLEGEIRQIMGAMS